MKPVINVLDTVTINKVAAGEVIERPSFVIKELVENSIDADASSITVEIQEGGLKLIRITDNGIGIPQDQVVKAFKRNATSKIKAAEDIVQAESYGFRGEALASIASVAQVELTTRWEDEEVGTFLEYRASSVITEKPIGCSVGTAISVKNLFFNAPARLKFLKRTSTEASYCSEILVRLALANPSISFKFINNERTIFHTPGNANLIDTIKCVYSHDIEEELMPVSYESNGVKITGFIGKPSIARSDKKNQIYFVNSRYIKTSPVIISAISRAYETLIMTRRYPFIVLNLNIEKELVDVNVHPAKLEVRFSNDSLVYEWVYHALKNSLNALSSDANLNPFKNSMDAVKNNNINSSTTPKTEEQAVFETLPIIDFSTGEVKSAINQNQNSENLQTQLKYDVYNAECNASVNENVDSESFNEKIEIKKEENVNLEQGFKFIGQLFSTYLIVEMRDKMILIDQHAVHERLNYEMLLKKLMDREINSQLLIKPEILDLSDEDYSIAFDNLELLKTFGFEFDEFGDNTIAIRSVPNFQLDDDYKNLFCEIIDKIKTVGIKNIYELKKDAVATMACKMSIKANKKLSDIEIEKLLKDINTLDGVTCPHGRPLIVELTKKEIEKMFKRIV